MKLRPDVCKQCPLYGEMLEGYVPPYVPSGATELIVGEAPGEDEQWMGMGFVGASGQWLENMLARSGRKKVQMGVVNTVCCRPPENVYPGSGKWPGDRRVAAAGVEYCGKHHLWPVVQSRPWRRILAVGGEALYQLTGKQGIQFWRGSPLPVKGGKRSVVMPMVHPSFLMRQSSLVSISTRDAGKSVEIPPEVYNLDMQLEELRQYAPKEFAFDFEWDMFTGQISLCGLSDRYYHANVVTWEGAKIAELQRLFEAADVLVGHNIIGADTKYTDAMGWKLRAKLIDTMLIQHLIQPDNKHDLAFVASVFTNKVAWKGKGRSSFKDDDDEETTGAQWKTWDKPDAIPRELGGYGGCKDGIEAFRLYNARDTDAEFQIRFPLWNTLVKYGMERVYWLVSVPMAYICRDLGERGLKVDKTKLGAARVELAKEMERLDGLLPEGLKSYTETVLKSVDAPPGAVKVERKVCKGTKKQPHEPQEVLWTEAGKKQCPQCGKTLEVKALKPLKRIKVEVQETVAPWKSAPKVLEYAKEKGYKEVRDRKTGNLTSGKNARKVWGQGKSLDEANEFVTLDQLKKVSTLYTNFAKEGLLKTDYMYFNLLVHGTGEGRLSSSGKRPGIDLNVQNIPEYMKKIFVPEKPGWGFLDFDVSQGENLLRCWFSKDWETMRRIQDGTLDEHSEVATLFFECEVTKHNENKHLRKAGKIINHAGGYGAGARTIKDNLALEGFFKSEAYVKAKLKELRDSRPFMTAWQDETIALAKQQGWLMNPFGRKRWFTMRDIGPKALAFLPASTLADCVLRMMIAMHAEKVYQTTVFRDVINDLGLQVAGSFCDGWRMVTQVHDSIVATGPWEAMMQNAEMMKAVMTQRWMELDGFSFGVEAKGGTVSLGDCEKLKI